MKNTAWHSVAAAVGLVWALALAPAPAGMEKADGWMGSPARDGGGGESQDESLWTYELVDGTAVVTDGPTEGDIVVPATLGGCPVVSIGYFAFQGCTGLLSVTLPATLAEIEANAFQGCDALAEFRMPDDALHCTVRDGVLFSKDMKTLLLYPPGKAGAYAIPEGVETIAGFAFASDAVTSLAIPGTVASIGDFALCLGNVPTLVVPESVTSVGAGVFLWCSGLKTLYLPSSWKSTTIFEDSGGAPGCIVIYYPTRAERRYAAWLENLGQTADTLPMDGDADLDGATNREECVAGTDPFDPADRFLRPASSSATGRWWWSPPRRCPAACTACTGAPTGPAPPIRPPSGTTSPGNQNSPAGTGASSAWAWTSPNRAVQELDNPEHPCKVRRPKTGGGWKMAGALGARASRPQRCWEAKTCRYSHVFHNLPSSGAAGSRTTGSHAMLVQKVPRHFRGCGILPRHVGDAAAEGRTASCHLALSIDL
jgi:hypothetical protein